ncbi:phenol-soluble modulin export ABC transporter ATP-binding protein PmtA [Cytobacillus sp. Hm23]
MEQVITVNNVNKLYKGFQLDDVSFSINKGFITGFIGPNGSGKTTMIKLLMNLIKYDAGDIQVFGMDHIKHSQEIKERIGFVYAENHFYEHLTIADIKKAIAPFYKNWDEEAFQRNINQFRLPLKKKLKQFSTGMKMKFSIAVALSHHADLIIMDEPTSGLDPVVRREILQLLTEIMQDEDKTIFFSTHITTDLEQIADYIIFINDGKIIFNKEKDEIFEEYQIVKGSNKYLTENIRQLAIGIKETDVGFEALTIDKKSMIALLGSNVIFERATLDDIMFYTNRSVQYV